MKLIDKILYYVSVPKCVRCGSRLNIEDRGICESCLCEYVSHKERNCASCGKPLHYCSCTNDYLDSHLIHNLVKVFRYQPDPKNVSSSLIYSLKRDNNRRVLDFLSDELVDAIRHSVDLPQEYIFTSVPRRRSAKRKYGIDHSMLLSSEVARKLGAEYMEVLASKSKRAQKKAGSIENRIKNIDLRLKNSDIDLTGKKVIIVDDIVTTGASMGASAMLIKSAGAKSIAGAALSIAYKDKKDFI